MQSQPLLSFWWVSCAYFCKTCNVCSVHIIHKIFYPTLFSVYKSILNIHPSPIFGSSPVYLFLSDLQLICLFDVTILISFESLYSSLFPLMLPPFSLSSLLSCVTDYSPNQSPWYQSCLFSKLSSTLLAGALFFIWYFSNYKIGTCFNKWNNARIGKVLESSVLNPNLIILLFLCSESFRLPP